MTMLCNACIVKEVPSKGIGDANIMVAKDICRAIGTSRTARAWDFCRPPSVIVFTTVILRLIVKATQFGKPSCKKLDVFIRKVSISLCTLLGTTKITFICCSWDLSICQYSLFALRPNCWLWENDQSGLPPHWCCVAFPICTLWPYFAPLPGVTPQKIVTGGLVEISCEETTTWRTAAGYLRPGVKMGRRGSICSTALFAAAISNADERWHPPACGVTNWIVEIL